MKNISQSILQYIDQLHNKINKQDNTNKSKDFDAKNKIIDIIKSPLNTLDEAKEKFITYLKNKNLPIDTLVNLENYINNLINKEDFLLKLILNLKMQLILLI